MINVSLKDFDMCDEKIRGFARLKPGWDSYQAEPIGQRAIAAALLVFYSLCRSGIETPEIVPVVDGGIQFEWSDLEIYIRRDGHVSLEAFTTEGLGVSDVIRISGAGAIVCGHHGQDSPKSPPGKRKEPRPVAHRKGPR